MSTCDLGGLGVLVTRPAEQAEVLAREIRRMGGVPTVYPGVEIEPLTRSASAALPQRLAEIDLVVFVSPTSVQIGMPLLVQKYGSLHRPRVAAVGHSTAAALRGYGLDDVIVPHLGSGSDALAAVAQFDDVSGWSVLVVKGEGGSDALESVLRSRGARVRLLECYRRRRPTAAFNLVEPLFRDGRIGAWMATSGEILDNLLFLAGAHGALLRDTPLFVNHPRVAVRGFSRAVKVIFVTAGGDKGLVGGLATWFCRLRPSTS